MNHEQRTALLDAAIQWLEAQSGQHLQYEPTFNGSWRYLGRKQNQGYNGRWFTDSHGNTRLQLTWHTFKHGGDTAKFDDFAVIQSLRSGKRTTYQPRKALPSKPTKPKKDTTQQDISKWRSSMMNGSSGYLKRKGISGVSCDSLRFDGANVLLMLQAFSDSDAPATVARGIQSITPNGNKLFSAGLAKRGAFVLVGEYPSKGDAVYICEGFATAASIHLATGAPTFAALDAGNIQHVARAVKKHCDVRIIIAGDNDAKSQTGQKAANYAALLVRGSVALPDDVGDFNDVHTRDGLQAVRTQLTPVMPDVATAFADDKAKHLKRLQGSGATFGKYLPTIDELPKGVTVIRSPQGTGKTFAMRSLIDEYQAQGLRVLYLTHRVSLAKDAARRLNLQHYDDVAGDYIRAVGSLAMCVNSLPRLRDANGVMSAFDVVIIDESEQLTRALAGSHIDNKKAVLGALEFFVRRADRLVCLDADAGLLTWRLLRHYRPNERIHRLNHHHEVGANRTLQTYEDKADVYARLIQATEPAFIVTNSKTESEQVYAFLTMHGKKGVLVNSDTSGHEHHLLADIDARCDGLDFMVCSPSISTGVSLESGYFKHVFGLFHSTVGTPSDALQALWRVRTPAQYHIWLDARVVTEHVDLDAKYGALIQHEQATLQRDVGERHTAYEDIKRLIDATERQAQAAFRLEFMRLANRQGFALQLQVASGEHSELMKQVRDTVTTWRHDQIEYSERHEPTRAAIRDFYRLQDSEQIRPWIELDNGGKYRKQVTRLERALGDVDSLQKIAGELLSDSSMAVDFYPIASEREFIRRVLKAVRFIDATKHITTCDEPEQANLPRYDADSLAPLLAWIESNRSWLAGLVALPSPDKLAANPLRYVASWLKRIGLKQVRSGKRHKGMYSLCLESLSTTCNVLRRRGVTLLLDKDIQEKVSPPPVASPEPTPKPSPTPEPRRVKLPTPPQTPAGWQYEHTLILPTGAQRHVWSEL